MANARELFITGLRNAHAMETQAHEMLERQVERMGDYPDLRARLRDHLEETKSQLKRLEQCLSNLGETTSSIKDAALGLGANMAAMAHAVAGDEVLKNTFANSGLEAYEIAAYKSLLRMADTADPKAAEALKQSLREEERMAEWVSNNVERITLEYMQKEGRAAA
jgi:ferritin-like metal-binding protein YciE